MFDADGSQLRSLIRRLNDVDEETRVRAATELLAASEDDGELFATVFKQIRFERLSPVVRLIGQRERSDLVPHLMAVLKLSVDDLAEFYTPLYEPLADDEIENISSSDQELLESEDLLDRHDGLEEVQREQCWSDQIGPVTLWYEPNELGELLAEDYLVLSEELQQVRDLVQAGMLPEALEALLECWDDLQLPCHDGPLAETYVRATETVLTLCDEHQRLNEISVALQTRAQVIVRDFPDVPEPADPEATSDEVEDEDDYAWDLAAWLTWRRVHEESAALREFWSDVEHVQADAIAALVRLNWVPAVPTLRSLSKDPPQGPYVRGEAHRAVMLLGRQRPKCLHCGRFVDLLTDEYCVFEDSGDVGHPKCLLKGGWDLIWNRGACWLFRGAGPEDEEYDEPEEEPSGDDDLDLDL